MKKTKSAETSKSQVDKFREAARELETDDREEAFDAIVKKIANMSLAFDEHYQPTDMPARFRYAATPYGEEEARAPIFFRNGFDKSPNTASGAVVDGKAAAGLLNVLAWASVAIMLGGLAAVFFSTNAVAAAVLPAGLIALTIVGFIAKRRDAKG